MLPLADEPQRWVDEWAPRDQIPEKKYAAFANWPPRPNGRSQRVNSRRHFTRRVKASRSSPAVACATPLDKLQPNHFEHGLLVRARSTHPAAPLSSKLPVATLGSSPKRSTSGPSISTLNARRLRSPRTACTRMNCVLWCGWCRRLCCSTVSRMRPRVPTPAVAAPFWGQRCGWSQPQASRCSSC